MSGKMAEKSIQRHSTMPQWQALKIIVPKTFLVRQWGYALKDVLDVPENDIGLCFGTHKDKSDRKYMICVINPARYSFRRHMMDD